MSNIQTIFDKNFLEYASYVIKDRAIPDLEDGLKPVQRRILHSLFAMDDGKFHKVANVIGHCMQYHPHGDASIGGALVVLANKELFIDKQGNFGNIFTGDEASAARYIECKANAFAKQVFYNPALTTMVDSYDGRHKEPLVFPAKVPVVLIMGAEGIAVGMSTKIMPHNLIETLEAEKSCLLGQEFHLYPDFPTGGLVDVSDYRDGTGKLLVRAKLDTSDPKRIVIRELPAGSTTESLINSIESAAKAGRIKIQSINDFTTEHVEIEIKLARGVYSAETVDALFAWTDCEQSLSVNLLVIKDHVPVLMTVTEIIQYHSQQLVSILKQELEREKKELQEKLRIKNMEKIFIEEHVYQIIEKKRSLETIEKAITERMSVLNQTLVPEDINRLLTIPIRRISLFDSSKAKAAITAMQTRIKELDMALKDITGYAIAFLDKLIETVRSAEGELFSGGKRKTIVGKFDKINLKELVKRDILVKYDDRTGYLGSAIAGQTVVVVSSLDRIISIRKNATYMITEVPDKTFIGSGAWWIGIADKDELAMRVFTIIYQVNGALYLKRCLIEGGFMNRLYALVPEDAEVIYLGDKARFTITAEYASKPHAKILTEDFHIEEYQVKSLKAKGVCLSHRELERIALDGVTLWRREKDSRILDS
ncbi:MAG: DNA topoisomerase IV subunit A [Spirochaetaceae bacterium]|jgi:topoisomerase-4 subunit A|nr:DNA topoisomerase IV subunit A [Spirochaetaceae bacterium]